MNKLQNTIRESLKADFPTCNLDRFETIVLRVTAAVQPLLKKPLDDLEKLQAEVDTAADQLPIPEVFADTEKNRTVGSLNDALRVLTKCRDSLRSEIKTKPEDAASDSRALAAVNALRLKDNPHGLLSLKRLGELHAFCDRCGARAPVGLQGKTCDLCGKGSFAHRRSFA